MVSYAYVMELDQGQLDALSAAVAEGTFEAAARYLHITPSAVSQRIKALETAVGRVLLTRTKPIHPTPSGQTLLRVARQLQTITAEAARELGTGPPDLKTVIPVAVNADSLATWFLPALAAVGLSCVFDLHRSDQDQLQDRYLRRRSRRRLHPPRHYVPGPADYAQAIWLGLGWGMLPDLQAPPGDLADFDPGHHIDVTLFWQRWRLRTTVLDRLSEAVQQASAGRLH